MRLCLELIWNCVLRRNLISYCQLIFLCSYMRPCFTCMDAFRQPICCCASSCLRHLLACVSLVPSPIIVPFNTCHVVSFFSFGVFYYIWYIYLWQRHGAIDFQFSQVYHAAIHFSIWPWSHWFSVFLGLPCTHSFFSLAWSTSASRSSSLYTTPKNHQQVYHAAIHFLVALDRHPASMQLLIAFNSIRVQQMAQRRPTMAGADFIVQGLQEHHQAYGVTSVMCFNHN